MRVVSTFRAGPRRRAAFWRKLGFPNLVRARAAKANKRRLRLLEEWEREELKRTPFAILDEPPPESSLVKRPRRSLATKSQDFVGDEERAPKGCANNPKPGCGWSALAARDRTYIARCTRGPLARLFAASKAFQIVLGHGLPGPRCAKRESSRNGDARNSSARPLRSWMTRRPSWPR